MKKFCTKCKIEKELADFSVDRRKKDNRRSQCKACCREYRQTHGKETAEYYQLYKKEIRASQQEYNQTEAGKVPQRKYRQEHPEEIKAKNTVNSAITAGKIQRSVFCEHCGLPAKTQGHHVDYSKPLDVDWLCPDCHIELHKNRRCAI